MSLFNLQSKFQPTGDQPKAIKKINDGIDAGWRDQTVLGVTGSGKTFTMANIIAHADRPTLIISHNKTLAAQLYGEFAKFFPDAAVHYFVSYYDYYQPEAYIPHTDTYIEKEATINEEIDRLRHAATQSLLSRRDCIIVASVSCIYGLGSPEDYVALGERFSVGETIKRNELLRRLVRIQYQRNDVAFERGQFRAKGDSIDIHLTTGEEMIRINMYGDQIEEILISKIKIPNKSVRDKDTKKAVDNSPAQKRGEPVHRLGMENVEVENHPPKNLDSIFILPAKHFMTPETRMKSAIKNIREELHERLNELKKNDRLVEADRLERKCNYDLEMMEELGYCNGIENYSRHLSGRATGLPAETLIDFFPDDLLMFIDESHVTLPQIRGMSAGDRSRKDTLVEFGFRLPSARDNRPLTFEEFDAKIKQVVYVSATPAEYELNISKVVAEQIIRPTGLLDPEIEVRSMSKQPSKKTNSPLSRGVPREGRGVSTSHTDITIAPSKNNNPIEDLIEEIEKNTQNKQRTLVTTLTKRMAEELSEYLAEAHIKSTYLHSEVDTMERVEILRDLRSGIYDVLVGINLLREGLDLPEVSLVAILDADIQGFLRNETSLIQTMGRAARHQNGRVIMYADTITPAMRAAITKTRERRLIQATYNKKHGIKPRSTEN